MAQLQAGDTVTIAFGGQAGTDPAVAWDDYLDRNQYVAGVFVPGGATVVPGSAGWASAVQALQAQYQAVINQYHVTNLDFDIEGFDPKYINDQSRQCRPPARRGDRGSRS